MAIQQASFYCPVCQQQRLFTRQRSVNHVLHLLIMVFTCGLWAFVWGVLILTDNPRYHCSQCGHSDGYKYLANPNLRSQEAHQNAERAAFQGKTSPSFSNSFTQWFLGSDNRKKVLVICLVLVLFSVVVNIIDRNQRSNTNANMAVNKLSNANSFSPTPTPVVALKDAPKTTAAKQSCTDIESELASVESDQARVEEMLDATEDFGEQAGSPKKAIYLNALKRKGELQLQHIALKRKLKACGKRK